MDDFSKDAIAIAISIAYCTAVIGAGELIRKLRGYGDEFTRKLVHIAIGVWIIPTLFLFTKWYWAAALPALAIIGNVLSYRLNILRGIERSDKGDFGTIFFPVSFVICIAAFFGTKHPEAAAAGIMAMALGDAAAAIVGKTFGRHKFELLGATKSIEGSAAMLVVSFAAVLVTLVIWKAPLGTAAAIALAVAGVGTALEAGGKHGLDNLTVPVVCSAVAFSLLVVMGGAPA